MLLDESDTLRIEYEESGSALESDFKDLSGQYDTAKSDHDKARAASDQRIIDLENQLKSEVGRG